MTDAFRLIIISGLSGSGKSVALHVLEDLGYYCIDNMPAALLPSLIEEITKPGDNPATRIAVGVDARNRRNDLSTLPDQIQTLNKAGIQTDLLFLQADDDELLKRYGETRRRHPLADAGIELHAAIERERDILGPVINAADLVPNQCLRACRRYSRKSRSAQDHKSVDSPAVVRIQARHSN
jgi:UPF0042 nucleotide-binding protein